MLITALAAATLLAWMSLWASLTLSAILTVILLPWALLSLRRSAGFAWTALALIAMTWRAETWKALCLIQEEQLCRLQPQCRQLLPKTTSSHLIRTLVLQERKFADAGVRFVPS